MSRRCPVSIRRTVQQALQKPGNTRNLPVKALQKAIFSDFKNTSPLKTLILFAAVFFYGIPLFADTAPGYIVLANQDTIFTSIVTNRYHPEYGYIPHDKKVYTEDHPDHRVDYSINDVSAFGFLSKNGWCHFRRKPVKLNGHLRFAEVLVDGRNATLYVRTVDAGNALVTDFFVEDNRREEHPVFYFTYSYLADNLKRDILQFFGFGATLGRLLDAGMKKNRWDDHEMIEIFTQYNKKTLE